MKAFFGKIWAWVLANKILAGIIAGGTAVVLAVAIAVPCGVSAAKKKKAQQNEPAQQQTTDGEGAGGQNGSGGTPSHTHNFEFDSFVWKETAGNYTAKAKFVCKEDKAEELKDAVVTKDTKEHVEPNCTDPGKDVWVATYEKESGTKDEILPALGHDWDTPSWDWSMDHSSCKAHFECKRCTAYEDKDASVIEDTSTLPTCDDSGLSNFTASVDFDGNHYEDVAESVFVPSLGHDINEHKFCTRCDEYFGFDISPTSPFYLDDVLDDSETKAFFRFEFAENEHYFIGLDGWIHDLMDHKFLYLNNNSELVDITDDIDLFYDNTSNWIPVNLDELLIDSKDSYLYVEILEFDNALDPTTAQMEVCTDHTDPNDYGYCLGGDFLGEPGVLDTNITLGQPNAGDKRYVRYQLHPEHEYLLTFQGFLGTELTVYYYSMDNSGFMPLERTAGKFTTPDEPDFTGEVVVVGQAGSDILIDAFVKIVVTEHDDLDLIGFCNTCGEYSGTTIVGSHQENINVANGASVAYKFAAKLHHSYVLNDPTMQDIHTYVDAYVKVGTAIEQITLDDSYYLEELEDGYIYIMINNTSGSAFVNGELYITEYEEVFNMYGLYECGGYLGKTLTLDEASDPFTLGVGEKAYFRFLLSGEFNSVEIDYSKNIGNDTCTVSTNRDSVWTDNTPDGGNIDYEEFVNILIPEDVGNYIYIVYENAEGSTITNQTITVSLFNF